MTLFRHAAIDEIIVNCTQDLFGHAACAVKYSGKEPCRELALPSDDLVATIGFLGEEARGALTLVSTPTVVKHSLPSGSDEALQYLTNSVLKDWSGELSNQLLGRIKNRLARHEVSFQVATPVSVPARELGVPPLEGTCTEWHRFTCKHGDLFVRLDLHVRPAFDLQNLDKITEASVPPIEGEMILF